MNPIIIIGEGIHVVSKEISKAIERRNPEPIQRLARLQAEAGADYLDLNLGPLTKNSVEIAQWIVTTVQEVTNLPLSIDTPNPEAMEAALNICRDRPLINSASGMKESKEKMLPLAQKYSTDVIVLLINDNGLPSDAEDRAVITMEIVEYANSLGIQNENIWIDGVLMPVCVNQEQIVQYLEFLKMVPNLVPGVKTVVGLSNISSCGTPKDLRGILNRTFMAMISRYNQSAVIADVLDKELIQLTRGELPEVLKLVYGIMDGEEIFQKNLTEREIAYIKSVDVLLGRKFYSHSWLER